MRFFIFASAFLATGCALATQPPVMIARQTNDWHAVVTPADVKRLRDWRDTFVRAVGQARAAGHGAEIDREGALLMPDSALGGSIPDGEFRCRVIKVGAQSPGMLDYVAYPYFNCRVSSEGRRHLVKLTGSQRQDGIIFSDGALRDVFLGTLMLGDEQRAFQYGVDDQRNVAGYIERIGDRRWRLVMPSPYYESQLDVMELVPR